MRSFAAVLPIALLVLMGSAAQAQQSLPCSPPLDRPLRLVMRQSIWLANGKAATVTLTRELRFRSDAQGMTVEARLTGAETDDPEPDARKRILIAYGAPGDASYRVRLDPAMTVTGIDDLDSHWQAFRTRQTKLVIAMEKAGKASARADAIIHALDSMGEAERVALLTGFLSPVLRYCGTTLPEAALRGTDGAIHVEESKEAGDAHDVSRYSVDADTGLMKVLDRSITSVAAPLQPLREAWTLGAIP